MELPVPGNIEPRNINKPYQYAIYNMQYIRKDFRFKPGVWILNSRKGGTRNSFLVEQTGKILAPS